MAETAAYLVDVDNIIPRVPVRQWVLSFPIPLRSLFAIHPAKLCASAQGFSLHAGVRCEAEDRQGIEQLCRYIARPAIANERLSVNREGNVVLKLKTAYRNGTTHIVMTPMEFMQRLAGRLGFRSRWRVDWAKSNGFFMECAVRFCRETVEFRGGIPRLTVYRVANRVSLGEK